MPDLSGLRVCFLAGTLGQGGAERQLFYILRALRQRDADACVLSLTRGEFWENKIRELGVPVTWVGQQRSRLIRLGRILSELRKSPPDVFQSQHFYTNLYVVAAARMLDLCEVGAMRSDGINDVRTTGVLLGYLCLRAPRMIAANSRTAIQNAARLGASVMCLHLLPNVVDIDRFKPRYGRDRGSIRLMAGGRLGPEKRLDRFLSILAHVRRNAERDVEGVIVGAGPLRLQLEQQAAELGLLPDAVEFRGVVPDMAAVYREVDIFVLTSAWEGTPNVVLEAMASGLPVVATQVGGVAEIIQDKETGYLVDTEDHMAGIVLRLIHDPELRYELGCRARGYVETHHSVHRLPAFLEDLYNVALP